MDEEIRRLRNALVVLVTIFVIAMGGFVFWVSAQIVQTHDSLALIKDKVNRPVEKIKGLDGHDGKDGIDGKDGRDGQNAVSTTTIIREPVTTIIQENVAVPGPQGQPGHAGREIQLGVTPLGEMVWRYIGDENWQHPEEVKL